MIFMKSKRVKIQSGLVVILVFIVLLTGSFSAFTQVIKENISQPIVRMGSSNTQSFDEDWLFARFGFQADGTSLTEPEGLEKPEINDAAWRKLNLPHDWAIEGPFRIELTGETGKLPYKGIGWYRKHFTIPAEDAGKQIFVDFDGAMAYSQVWLNGNYVGTWPYGYSSFRMDLTPFVKPGQKNVIAVRLDTEKWDSRWYPGAGIYRHVWLLKTNPVHVAHWGTYITTPEISDASAQVELEVNVENKDKNPVEAEIQTTIFQIDINDKPGVKVSSFNKSRISIAAGSSEKVKFPGYYLQSETLGYYFTKPLSCSNKCTC
jgi:beta-galactosidase